MNTAEDISLNTKVKASAKAVDCQIDGEIVLLHLDSGTYFGLNAVGAEIWNYIREEKSLEDIQDYLLARYDVPRARCETEVRALLSSLAAQDLITIKSHEASS